MPSDTCPTCGSDAPECVKHRHIGTYKGAHASKWSGHPTFSIAAHDDDREDCRNAWHLEAAATPPTSDAVREALDSLQYCVHHGDAPTEEVAVTITSALADRADAAKHREDAATISALREVAGIAEQLGITLEAHAVMNRSSMTTKVVGAAEVWRLQAALATALANLKGADNG